MSSITYIHLIDIILNPENLAIESIAFRSPVSVINIYHMYTTNQNDFQRYLSEL